MVSPTSHGTAAGACCTPPRIASTSVKVATASASHCDGAAACGRADRERGEIEHQMREHRAGDAAGALHRDVGQRPRATANSPRAANTRRHRRIEVRAGHRPEDRDQHHEDRAGRDRVAEQRERRISAREPLAP